MRKLLICVSCVVLAMWAPTLARAQSEPKDLEFTGPQLEQIIRAWRALHVTLAPEASLSEFSAIRYGTDQGRGVVEFYRPPPGMKHADGSVLVSNRSNYYVVVLDGAGVEITEREEALGR